MTRSSLLRLDHLKRMTDAHGLIHAALGEYPDRFGGYDTIDNADALRLCAMASDTVTGESFVHLARLYFQFLTEAKQADGRVHHHRDARGFWTDGGDDALVQARLARALAAVITSELPIPMRLTAADWWGQLISCADSAESNIAAAHWLVALGQLRKADPGRDVQRAGRLAARLADSFAAHRAAEWDWFEESWAPGAAVMAAGMWAASQILDEPRYAEIARLATQFVTEHLFEDGICQPVGMPGGWSKGSSRSQTNVAPAEVTSLVELLCLAEMVTGCESYGVAAEQAAGWFTGLNAQRRSLVDPETGGCYDAMTAGGVNPNESAPATVAYLLAKAATASRVACVEEASNTYVPVVG